MKLLHGSYALGLLDEEDKDTIYVAKNKSPLLIGVGEGFNVIASDALAMLQATNQYKEKFMTMKLLLLNVMMSSLKILMVIRS